MKAMDQTSSLSTRTKLIITAVAVLIVVFGILSSKHVFDRKPSTASSSAVPDPTVHITSAGFNPALVTVKQGHKVSWINDDTASHMVVTTVPAATDPTSVDTPTSPLLSFGQTYSYTVTHTKRISYHDSANASHGGIVLIQP